MHSYWGSKKKATLHDLVRHANSLRKFQHESHNTETLHQHEKMDDNRVNQARRGRNVNLIKSTSSRSNKLPRKSSRKNKSSSRSLTYPMHIWHQLLQHTLPSFPHRYQRRRLTMRFFAASVQRQTIRRHNLQWYPQSSALRWSPCMRPTFHYYQDVLDSACRTLTATDYRQKPEIGSRTGDGRPQGASNQSVPHCASYSKSQPVRRTPTTQPVTKN